MLSINIRDLIGGVLLNKIDTTLQKIIKQFRKILEENPNFTGNTSQDFCLGGLTNFKKTEKIKIK